jgi:hypothetical protein
VPVKTIWSREETMAQGRFRTPIMTRFKAVLGKDGMPDRWLGLYDSAKKMIDPTYPEPAE